MARQYVTVQTTYRLAPSNPTPGSTDAWRYGCGLGFPASDPIDGKAGWNFALVHCEADKVKCSVVAQPAASVSRAG